MRCVAASLPAIQYRITSHKHTCVVRGLVVVHLSCAPAAGTVFNESRSRPARQVLCTYIVSLVCIGYRQCAVTSEQCVYVSFSLPRVPVSLSPVSTLGRAALTEMPDA